MNRRIRFPIVGLAALLLLAGCAPAIRHPVALVSPLSYDAAYLAVVHAINVQPYPAGTGGWVITQASKSGGFLTAQLGERRCSVGGFDPFDQPRCQDYRSLVNVTLVERPDGRTEVNLGTNGTYLASELGAAIRDALKLTPSSD